MIFTWVVVQENYHTSTLFAAMRQDPSLDIFESLLPAQSYELRRMMITMVLGTDMTLHFNHIKELRGLLDQCGHDVSRWEPHMDSLMCWILHTADISNPAKPLEMATFWADRCLEEFFEQGDREKKLKLAISPMCNRETTSTPQTQIGFIKFIVLPTYKLMAEMLPAVDMCVSILDSNLKYWEEQAAVTSLSSATSAA